MRPVVATGFSSVFRDSQSRILLHGKQGVKSSSLLGSIQEKPSLWLGFLLPMRGDDPARCPVLVQKDEAVQALGTYLTKGAGLGI